MKNIGFIGFGSMGSMLVKGMISRSNIDQNNITVTRRNKDKLKEIKDIWPLIKVTKDAAEVVRKSEIIFICVKPLEYRSILEEIKPLLKPDHHIISMAGSLMIEDLEKIASCKITKIMPTVISEVNEGITLICHNEKVTLTDAKIFEALLDGFTILRETAEEQFGLATEFTSCGPGLYAAILNEYVEAGLRYSKDFTKDEISKMVLQTVLGTAKLMLEQDMDFSQVVGRVATKGGLTEEGVKIIKKEMPSVFDEMIERSLTKRSVTCDQIHKQFSDL